MTALTMTGVAERMERISHSPAETQQWGEELGKLLEAGDVIALQGELGSGKTNFVKGVARGLGLRDDVHSPTFILANEYRGGRLALFHIDAYRVRDEAEAIGFGLEDYLDGSGVTLIEWAERVGRALPPEKLWIEFRHVSEDERSISMCARGAHYQRLLDALRK